LSEAEFEYAARGRTSPGVYPRFWFGDDEKVLCRYGNFSDRLKDAPCDDGYGVTSPVGHYAPNAFGLYDMAGNAWQWTDDCWHISYNGAPTDGSARARGFFGPTCGVDHVMRGGSWVSEPSNLRTANTGEFHGTGFRLARILVP
jgi:formylglycine-generating enzyme required for sulfatase activity